MKKLGIALSIALAGWFSAAVALDTKAETLVIPLEDGMITTEGADLLESIGFRDRFASRPDKDYFLIAPEKYPQEFCMARNIFFEASIDSNAGMAAVADVVLNRVRDSRYPDNVCGVVHQAVMQESWKTRQNPDLDDSERVYYPKRHRCQFSWYCDGKADDIPLGSENWVRAQMVAWEMMHEGRFRGITEGSTHYHATYVDPSWATSHNMDLVGRIGLHIFYRWN